MFKRISLLIALCVIGVHALGKRDVQNCITSLDTIDPAAANVKNTLNAYHQSLGYGGALVLQDQGKVVETSIRGAIDACCSEPVWTEEDTAAIVTALRKTTTSIQSTLGAFVTKKPDFDSVPLATQVVTQTMISLLPITHEWVGCLQAHTPKAYAPAVHGQAILIETAVDRTNEAYGLL